MTSNVNWPAAKRLFEMALSLPASERDAFLRRECADDETLLSEVRSLLAWEEKAEGFLDRAPVRVTDLMAALDPGRTRVGETLGAWRILDVIGQGGMGIVYRAERADAAFQRPAAIKVVRRGRDSASIVERFQRERETLAALDHPNIARLMDGGTTPDGEPYFVMEYVDGMPVDRFCDDKGLSVERRLDLFRTICAGVQYAHQNLIVHRDIKPDNILVSREGVPKLLDFGVAKILSSPGDDGDDDAASTTWLLTPDYASPEQVTGRAPVTTATDVYSLGVLLYVLLTGCRPYHFSGTTQSSIEAQLASVELVAPSVRVVEDAGRDAKAAVRATTPAKLARRLTGDLDAIVARALGRDPQHRYQSVDQLVQDLERYRSGHPVSSRQPTLTYVAGRFVRRHAVALALSGIVVATLVSGAGTIWWQANEAAEARALAERRFEDVQRLAHAFMFDVHDAIANVPGTTEARALLVATGVEYLERLASEARGDLDLQRELASGFLKMGDALGNPTGHNLGDTAGARTNYERVVETASSLLAAAPDDVETARTLALAHRRLGDVVSWAGDLPQALEHAERSDRLFKDLAARPRSTFDDRLQAAIAEIKVGDLLGNPVFPNLGRRDDAAGRYREALGAFQQLDRDAPNDRRVRRFLGIVFERLGTLHEEDDRLEDAAAAYDQSFRIREDLAASVARHTDIERDLAIAFERVGNVQRRKGDLPAAAASYRGSLDRFVRLRDVDPSNANAVRSVAVSQEKLAQVLDLLGREDEALELLREALGAYRGMVARDLGNAQARCDVARVSEAVGDLAWTAPQRTPARVALACREWQAGLEAHRALRADAITTCTGPEIERQMAAKVERCR